MFSKESTASLKESTFAKKAIMEFAKNKICSDVVGIEAITFFKNAVMRFCEKNCNYEI